jgi:hypothetical protein
MSRITLWRHVSIICQIVFWWPVSASLNRKAYKFPVS